MTRFALFGALLLAADAGLTVRRGAPPFPGTTFKSRLLASAESRQVWGIDPAEIEWVSAHLDGVLASHVRLAASEGGLRVAEVKGDGIAAARGLRGGDVVKDLNGSPVRSKAELREMLASPAFRRSSGVRLTVVRGGKPLVLDYRPLPR